MITPDPSDLIAAVAELSDAERRVLEIRAFALARTAAERGESRLSDVLRCAGALLAEEGDRRRDVLAALDPDTGVGEFVGDATGLDEADARAMTREHIERDPP